MEGGLGSPQPGAETLPSDGPGASCCTSRQTCQRRCDAEIGETGHAVESEAAERREQSSCQQLVQLLDCCSNGVSLKPRLSRDQLLAAEARVHRHHQHVVDVAGDLFEHLDAPIRRVGALDTPVAYCPDLEDVILPQPADILKAIRETARY